MIDFDELMKREVLASVEKRAQEEAEAYELAESTWKNLYQILPPANTSDARAELDKIEAQITSMGPEIIATKLEGIIGNITWGSATGSVDAQLEELDLRDLAHKSAKSLVISGIAALLPYVDMDGTTRLQRLGGHLMPIYAEDDIDRLVGLYQAWMHDADREWTIRVYDFEQSILREWKKVGSPTAMATLPVETPLTTLPVVAIANRLQDGTPEGEFWQHSGLIKQEMAAQAAILRTARRHAHPLTIIRGMIDESRSSIGLGGVAYFTDSSGSVERLEPGDLAQLYNQHDSLQARIRSALNLPATFGGAAIPSGEALKQANQRYSQSCSAYTILLQRLLSQAVAGFAELVGITNPPEVAVYPNLLNSQTENVDMALKLYQAEILPLEQAMRMVQPYIPTWDDKQLEEDIQRRTKPISTPAAMPTPDNAQTVA